jgi:hypothetical protein
MPHFKDLKDMHQIYTFIDREGVNTHIDSVGLREWCLANKPETFWVPIDPKLARSFLRNNTISTERVLQLLEKPSLDPIILVKDGTNSLKNGGPNVMLVDGHHRYYFANACRMTMIPGHVLEVEQWRPFIVEGVPPLTQEQLRNMPIMKRNY